MKSNAKAYQDKVYHKLKSSLIAEFRRESYYIKELYGDNHQLIIKKPGDSSIFSKFIGEEYLENEHEFYNAKTHWDEIHIEIYLNDRDDSEYFAFLKVDPCKNYFTIKFKHTFI